MKGEGWALLDRDGTIIVNRPYLTDPDGVELIPGSAEAITQLRSLGLSIGVVTNQSVIGLGRLDEAGLERIHGRMIELLAAAGASVDAIVHCPHVASDGCTCRKPKPGLVTQIAATRPLDPTKSYVVGDDTKDIGLARAIGATAILVRTGHGLDVERDGVTAPDWVEDDLAAAARRIASLVTTPR